MERGVGIGIGIGVEKGIEKGMEKSYTEITERMIENNMSNADIHKITGLPLSKIGQIRRKMSGSRGKSG